MEILAWLTLIGFSASFIGGLVGLGGGFLMVPLMNLGLGLDFKDSVFLSLVGVFCLSIAKNSQNRDLVREYKEKIVPLLLFSVCGAIAAGLIGRMAPSKILSLLFALLLIVVALYEIVDPFKNKEVSSASKSRETLARSLIFLSGLVSGLFGIGAGVVTIPVLYRILGFPIQTAARLSYFFILVTSGAALITLFQQRREAIAEIPVTYPVFIAIGVLGGFFVSKRIKLSDKRLKKLFAVLLLGIGSWQLFNLFVLK